MANKNALERILEHPDRDEIISKLLIGLSVKEIHEWLSHKYKNPSEKKFVISDKFLKSFQENYLDLYKIIKEDLSSAKSAIYDNKVDDIELYIKNNKEYKNKIIDIASQELDVKKMLANMINNIETRTMQLIDQIQDDPTVVNSRTERLLLEYYDRFGAFLEKWQKYVLQTPDQVVQHNVTVQHIDKYVQVVYDAIKETLTYIDVEASLKFMEIFPEMLEKLKLPNEKVTPVENRLAEVKIINESINKKLNEEDN